MSKEAFTLAYDGPALQGGVMDVRDLAPALMALGQLLDAANANLNGDSTKLKLHVTATGRGSFQISFELIQSWTQHVLEFFATQDMSGATNLLNWVLGVPTGGASLIGLIKKLRGRNPDSVEKLAPNMMRIVFDGESFDAPVELLRLYQDVSVRNALQKLIEEPLAREGIDEFKVLKDGVVKETVTKADALYFVRPSLDDETLIEDVRRSAFSIVSLAFKEDNKWRLYDGHTQISAWITDQDFMKKVDESHISFAKGDILLCDVRVIQKRTAEGLKTDYIVEKVVEHRPAARQLPLILPKRDRD